MKNFYILLICCFCQYHIRAQMQYTFTPQASSFQLLSGDSPVTLSAAFSPSKTALDEGFANNIPIGFSFFYDGKKYTSIHLNVNGFASLGAPFLASNTDPQYEVNELRNPVAYKGAVRPIIAPLWDDLKLASANDLSYKTEGSAPNRVFIAQWKNVIWQNGSGNANDFQLRLYETSNVVAFLYNNQAGSVGNGASASMGITSDQKVIPDIDFGVPYFISIGAPGINPSSSTTMETDTIKIKPATGQEFKFLPVACAPPTEILLGSYNSNSATIKWTVPTTATSCQIALSNLDLIPVSSTTVTDSIHAFSNLAPNTEYFFYIKQTCGSTWSKLKFKTGKSATLPFMETFESSLDNAVPDGFGVQGGRNDFGDMHWQTSELINASGGIKKAINSSRFATSNSWLFMPSMHLTVGGVYQLSFKYSRTPATNIGFGTNPKLNLKVQYGSMAGESAMFLDIINLDSIINTSYLTQNVSFSPPFSGDYNIGFLYQAGVSDAIVLLDDVGVTVVSTPLPVDLLDFEAQLLLDNTVKLTWQTENEVGVTHFEVQRANDGRNFEFIGNVSANNSNISKNEYQFIDKKPNFGHNYYRLKAVDFDGQFEYSPIRQISIGEELVTYLYPNPSGNEVYLKIPDPSGAIINVYSMDGKLLSARIVSTSDNEVKIELPNAMSDQIYMVSIQTHSETRILKWMIH